MRTAFIDTLCEIAAERDDIVLMCGDLGFSVLEPFAERFPGRYFNAGICEQGMMGMAAGMALSGKTVITYSIANFAILRCLEQFRNDVCYHNASVIVVSVGTGAAYGAQGYTHHGIEDMACTRTLPNAAIVSPGDPEEVRWALRALVARGRPANLRLGRGGEPAIHKPGSLSGPLEKAITLQPGGRDVILLSTGSPLPEALTAAAALKQSGLDVGLVSCPSVTPLDSDDLAGWARQARLVVTVEEHITEAGFGGAVAEVISGLSGRRATLLRAGIARNGPKTAADQKEVRRQFSFDAAGLEAQIRQRLAAL